MAGKKVAKPPKGAQDVAGFTYASMPGEAFKLVDDAGSNASNEELNSRFAKGEVRIVTESARYSLAGILNMLKEDVSVEGAPDGTKEKRYKLDPDYQRRHRWSVQRQSRLIESFLINIPVPPIFLYERDLALFEVMDGRQRLTALADFYGGAFALEGLEYWPDLNGKKYKELPSKIRAGIDRRYISSIILLKETASSKEQAAFLKKLVFERLNSGGVKLSAQETRNAVYGGPLNTLCLELSKNEKFRLMWGIPPGIEEVVICDDADQPYEEQTSGTSTRLGVAMFERMDDVELVLRFFAFRHIQASKAGLNRISEFLDSFLRRGNEYGNDVLDAYRDQFSATIDFLYECLGLDAFTVVSARPQRPAKIVYDAIMYVANAPDVVAARPRIVSRKDLLRAALVEMYARDKEGTQPSFAGRRTNSSDVVGRNQAMRNAFERVLRQI